jgi:hypothetical protein
VILERERGARAEKGNMWMIGFGGIMNGCSLMVSFALRKN